MNILKNNFERLKNCTAVMLCILCALFFAATGCGEQKYVSQENDAPIEELEAMEECVEDLNDLADCVEGLGWAVRLILKPQEDKSYLATKDPEIKVLVEKYDLEFYQTCEGFENPELLLYYDLVRRDCDNSNKINAIKNFLATGKFQDCVYEYEIAYIAL